MEITVEKMALIREERNPKNKNLNLDVDWSVEFMNTDQRDIKYDIVLKSEKYFNLNFKVEGLIRLRDFEEFINQEFSQLVFHHACEILMNVISLTRQHDCMLFNEEIGSAVDFNATL